MPRIIKSGLIQMSLPKTEGEGTIEEIKEAMEQKHIPFIEEAGKKGVQILCLQEIFNTPYFCPGQDKAWYESAEAVPGPTIERMQEYAKKYSMVMIVPVYEKEQAEANGYVMGCINRVGEERPWKVGKFYGSSYFVDPRGQIFAQASEDKDELLIAEFDLDMIEEVRSVWQFFRDRRPETYGKLV